MILICKLFANFCNVRKNLNVWLTTSKKRDDIQYTQKYLEIPRNTRKYPRVKKIPENTRSYISTLLPDPNPTRYPVFFPIPDPTRPDVEKPYPLGTAYGQCPNRGDANRNGASLRSSSFIIIITAIINSQSLKDAYSGYCFGWTTFGYNKLHSTAFSLNWAKV